MEFGKYVGNELRTVKNHSAMQRAKLEINRILFCVTTGQYSSTQLESAFVEVKNPDQDDISISQINPEEHQIHFKFE